MLNVVLPLMCNTRTRTNTSTLNDADVVSDVVLRQTDRGAAGYDAVARTPDLEHGIKHWLSLPLELQLRSRIVQLPT